MSPCPRPYRHASPTSSGGGERPVRRAFFFPICRDVGVGMYFHNQLIGLVRKITFQTG